MLELTPQEDRYGVLSTFARTKGTVCARNLIATAHRETAVPRKNPGGCPYLRIFLRKSGENGKKLLQQGVNGVIMRIQFIAVQ